MEDPRDKSCDFFKFFHCGVNGTDRSPLAPAYKIKPLIPQGGPEVVYVVRYIPDSIFIPPLNCTGSGAGGRKCLHRDALAENVCIYRIKPEMFIHPEAMDKNDHGPVSAAFVDGYIEFQINYYFMSTVSIFSKLPSLSRYTTSFTCAFLIIRRHSRQGCPFAGVPSSSNPAI